MKQALLILFFFISCFSNAQIKNSYNQKNDSVFIETYSYYDKETSSINDTIEKNRTTLKKSKQLTKKEIEALNEKLISTKSYSKNRALLSHFDVKIIYYFDSKIIQYIIYSSITKNLTIYKSDKCVFKGQATHYLQKQITKLLNN